MEARRFNRRGRKDGRGTQRREEAKTQKGLSANGANLRESQPSLCLCAFVVHFRLVCFGPDLLPNIRPVGVHYRRLAVSRSGPWEDDATAFRVDDYSAR